MKKEKISINTYLKMVIKKKFNRRFFLFSLDNYFFIYDNKTQVIYKVNGALYKLFFQKSILKILLKYPKFFKKIFLSKFRKLEIHDNFNCNITLNYTNKCNLDCKYCYRDKNDINELSDLQITQIIDYIINVYNPTAKRYSIAPSFTSESSIDCDRLLLIDKVLAMNEGYYYSTAFYNDTDIRTIYDSIPESIKNKYIIGNTTYIAQLNRIMENEDLATLFNVKNDETIFNELSLSYRVKTNRKILDSIFPQYSNKLTKEISMGFMTNGTNITKEYIQFLKSRFINSIYVSIDGTKEIHDGMRINKNGQGSYNKVVEGIKKLQDNDIKVVGAFVVTSLHPDIYNITSYLISLNVDKVSFNLVRGNNSYSHFSKQQLNTLIKSSKKVYNKFYLEYKENKYIFTYVLRDSFFIRILIDLYQKRFVLNRCNFSNNLAIDSKGNCYHCHSTIGCKNDYLGNIFSNNITAKKTNLTLSVETDNDCKNCFAKYLCGGKCYSDVYNNNFDNNKSECYFRKNTIIIAIKFFTSLLLKNEAIDFMENILRINKS